VGNPRKYRAKLESDNGELRKGDWVYGHYCELKDGKKSIPHIYGFGAVDRSTVSQEIGVEDKYGNPIYEGDIVHMVHHSLYAGIPDSDFGLGIVRFNGDYFSGVAYQIKCIGETGSRVFSVNLIVEIIGNIWDNPELLKKYEQCCWF
jgi:uncharacterized phage protein (TIGR01671 family)